ncbi:hypothetical protein M426DRAFT_17069 [Hypoxylon sp. CI-4A]|nr:hypothetical protein M426DRAFT_17069 [Hypoxylon sp. CI-4A]
MATSPQHPKTIDQLQRELRLKDRLQAQSLVRADAVKEAFRKYMNRCLSAISITKQLPDWKDVDEYLQEKRTSPHVRIMGRRVEELVERDCIDSPYELLYHASLFALRIMTFLRSKTGEKYDISQNHRSIKHNTDLKFDRCVRIMNLLGFLVNQHRETMTERQRKKDRQKKETSWI